mgnify:CR=1 FL=1
METNGARIIVMVKFLYPANDDDFIISRYCHEELSCLNFFFSLSLFLSLFQYFSLSNSGNNIFLTFGYLNFSFSFVVVMIVTSRYHHHHHHVNPQYHQRHEEERNRIYPTLFPDFFPSQNNARTFFSYCVLFVALNLSLLQ